MTDTAAFLDEARAILGERGLTTDADLLDPWLTDWRGRFTGRALALASPAATEQVADLVKLCARHGVPIVPQGGNSGMCGGATPDASGEAIILSLRRMDKVRHFDKSARQIVCEAGLVLQTLHEVAGAQGMRFPLTLGGKGSATVGGLIATNAGGTQVLRHGSMRAQVLGLEGVMADGAVFDGLTVLKKDNRGFDLKQLLIGSEGTLGIVTAATLRLLPALGDRRVVWAGLPSLAAARRLLTHCQDEAGDALEGFEVMAQPTLDDVIRHLPDARQPLAGRHAWHALIELVADDADAQSLGERTEAMLAGALERGLLDDAVIAANEAQAEGFWLLRDSIAAAEREKGPAVQHDISVPVEKMPEFVDFAVPRIERDWPGTEALAFGHLGDGNVHFHVIAPDGVEPMDWMTGDGKAISAQVYRMVSEWDGSISAEHGIGQLKRDELAQLSDPARLAIMRQVKRALDPNNILNPGKLVPLAPDAPIQ
ncbi:FAD-binding oxidoreductase [Aurantiacibacter spongiae]|uniref:FAD-binding oxidoreductase n=1 Tax=Aurantiacibacter spongiae TaxID=2488860 RepID=A0A3N5DG42_9SPHN|nr:FAD-binding oxidoreductase [Aurantiacibacter spongiae]RPF70642.1 FAD-binding oxidoreductase [Aurantiacibacter spongiae]